MNGILFGSTCSRQRRPARGPTGLASAKLGDYQLAVSDIFGGNAFLPVLFFLAGLLSGQAVFRNSGIRTCLIGLGISSLRLHLWPDLPTRRGLRMGLDSLVVLALYLLGTAGLMLVEQG